MPIGLLVILVVAAFLALWVLFAITHLVLGLLPILLVGLLAGWVASRLLGSRYGIVGTTLVGVIGSILGPLLFGALLHVAANGLFNPIHLLASIAGATVLLGGMRVVEHRSLPYQPRGRLRF